MKIKYLILPIAICAALSACIRNKPAHVQPDIYTDTLAYQYQVINNKADDCGTKADSNCTTVKFKYPVFDKAGLLNDTIVTGLAMLMDRQKGLAGLQRLTWNFLAEYNKFKKAHPDWKGKFELNSNADVVRQDSDLVTIELKGYQFTGGAHGSSLTRYINWTVSGQKKLELADLINTGAETQLSEVAEKIFRKQEKLSDTASLSRDYFFKGGKFSLNRNFLITPLGLKFLYNQYEIKPYAAGQTVIDIPYTSISKLLKPGTVLARYTK